MALYQKGQSGNPAGRKRGSKNKIRYDVAQLLEDVRFNPFLKLVELAKNATSQKVQCEAASQLAGYCAAKLKNMEVEKNQNGNYEISINIGDEKFNPIAHAVVTDTTTTPIDIKVPSNGS